MTTTMRRQRARVSGDFMRKLCNARITKRIADKVRGGASIKRAAPAVGVRYDTVKVWLHKGRQARELDDAGERVPEELQDYYAFLEAMDRAKAQWAERAERRVYAASQNGHGNRGDWKAAAYLLERRYGSDYRLPPLARLEPNAGDPAGGVGDQVPSQSDEGTTITVLVYPVPVPIGADLRKLQLPAGHALEHAIDTKGEGEGGTNGRA